ncbi:unnamed protein product [Brassica oleracea var. botrytis]
MDYDNKGCQSPPEGPKLCINNCGFFRSDATMNMCFNRNRVLSFCICTVWIIQQHPKGNLHCCVG